MGEYRTSAGHLALDMNHRPANQMLRRPQASRYLGPNQLALTSDIPLISRWSGVLRLLYSYDVCYDVYYSAEVRRMCYHD